jgi:hypothetical protein
MTAVVMPRKPKTIKLDERLIAALETLARESGESIGGYVERVLWRYCQGVGALDPKAEPSKDTRGGKRTNAGRKPKNTDGEGPGDHPEE